MKKSSNISIPMRWIGPLKITGNIIQESVKVPLATYEIPLWYSVDRGARISRLCNNGIRTTLIDERMSRSIFFETDNAEMALTALQEIVINKIEIARVSESTSRFIRFINLHYQITGNLLFLRMEFSTGDASGHNMVTKAAEAVMNWILSKWSYLRYGSISGNICSDKKATAINGIMGRGKNFVAEIIVSRELCNKYLRTSPEKIVNLNNKKNLIGTFLAGGIRSANAHFSNMLLAYYLATGQDGANIVEGSQGLTYAEVKDDCLWFSCTIPNLIIGSIGNGKNIDTIRDNIAALGCAEERSVGENARRLAAICAATVLCGELSLIAAQTNPGELMSAHLRLERTLSGG
ncbi:hydroxymethylglutaryl-CoA reductase [Candidatus Liberibacter americanus]|uniref:Hydroxymethylglutaryl-CoA reductase n=1 Tax=Candidatus Liberibacter americanus str. Sao Paulo TaxID=1261131 RepID=U6B5K5_9HYPH|nr:hydroxymethylglutaryl-CoA reductase [Candidatus Liberibacter americanus]AHA28068.1 Hydroxymethylglutaryl-CoA reductase [Candidatus Liberibacter americanus str. Sao Paulo]EMS35963.1 hydroxymethylglutaryl-coenzyme A (HMG-CoA) reductase [Candidatus Liberibacter americanus PW_SP]